MKVRCGNTAHEGGMCKFHLDGYLSAGTADEVRKRFWEKHDSADTEALLDCDGYILPSLAQEGGPSR